MTALIQLIYVNGAQTNTSAYPLAVGQNVAVGANPALSYGEKFNGYLSEVYFVDGYVKPPETFGKYFPNDTDPDKRWGPLDSTVVEAAINTGPIQPYDTRANTSQVWSNQVTATTGTVNPSYPITNAFDGNFSTFALCSTNTGVYGASPGIGVAGDVVTYYGTQWWRNNN